jgi:hypothetical protein
MKNYRKIFFLILIFGLLSCESDKKNELIGVWESFEKNHTKNVLTFFNDSLILDAYNGEYHTNSKWEIDDEKIYLKNIKLKDSVIINSLVYQYTINKSKLNNYC